MDWDLICAAGPLTHLFFDFLQNQKNPESDPLGQIMVGARFSASGCLLAWAIGLPLRTECFPVGLLP